MHHNLCDTKTLQYVNIILICDHMFDTSSFYEKYILWYQLILWDKKGQHLHVFSWRVTITIFKSLNEQKNAWKQHIKIFWQFLMWYTRVSWSYFEFKWQFFFFLPSVMHPQGFQRETSHFGRDQWVPQPEVHARWLAEPTHFCLFPLSKEDARTWSKKNPGFWKRLKLAHPLVHLH